MKQAAEAGVGIRVSPERLLPLWLTGGLFAVGLASFAAIPAVVWIARGPLAQGIFAQHGVVLLAHLYALGWGTAVALGAWQQLAPVALQVAFPRSEEHTSELQSRENLVCRLLLEKKKSQPE